MKIIDRSASFWGALWLTLAGCVPLPNDLGGGGADTGGEGVLTSDEGSGSTGNLGASGPLPDPVGTGTTDGSAGATGQATGATSETPAGGGGPGEPSAIACGEVMIPDCPTLSVLDDDLTLSSVADVEAAQCYSGVNGDLRIEMGGEVALPHLETIGEDLYLHQNYGVEALRLPALTSVVGHVYFHQNFALTAVDLGALQTVGEYTYFSKNTALSCLDLDSLESTSGYFYVSGQSSLETLSLPALQSTVDYLYISHTPLLSLSVPQFVDIVPGPDFFEEEFDYLPYIYINHAPALGTCLEWQGLFSSMVTPLASATINGDSCPL